MYQTHTLHSDPMRLRVSCPPIGRKSTFCRMSRADKEASYRSARPFNSEGKAMWPFYTVCLRMRVLGVSRAT